jgi:hypothetical protein
MWSATVLFSQPVPARLAMTVPAEPVSAALDRHAVRRAGGVPTVSVIVGPVGAGGAAWRRWAAASGCPNVTAHAPDDFPTNWLGELARRVDLPSAAVGAIADHLGRDRTEFAAAWRGKTAADRARFWDAVFPPRAEPVTRALADLASDDIPSPAVVVATALQRDTTDAVLRDVAALVPGGIVPVALFVAPPATDMAVWFAGIAPEIAGWVLRLPGIALAVAVTAPAWEAYSAATPEGRVKAVLREGVVEIPVLGPAAITHVLADAGLGPDAAAVGEALADGGATDHLARSAADAVRANVPPPATPEANDRARSAAERFLFDLLETIPETAGRFESNAILDFRFGPRPAEVDLFARADRLAVEVDGYFHFRDPDAYRRDRAKDYELRRRGYFVLRFLADDVVRRVEQVRDRILEALAQVPPGGHP